MAERLQKVLATAGIGSRRACEELILEGRVSVNGKRVAQLPVLVDPNVDEIKVDRRRIRIEPKVYYLLNKPKGVFCTQSDPDNRKRPVDLMPGVKERVYPIGRLDADSQGLLLMTNDGDLAARLTHPRYGVPKTYRARVAGKLTEDDFQQLREGMWLSDGRMKASRVTVIYSSHEQTVLEITLREGRNRQVRRMLAKLGHAVRDLTRIRIGRLDLRGLGVGKYRRLGPGEVKYLRDLIEVSTAKRAEAKRRASSKKKAPPATQRKETPRREKTIRGEKTTRDRKTIRVKKTTRVKKTRSAPAAGPTKRPQRKRKR
ncbi:MAG: pseudouridine synthase [Phycisphaerae bacterium]|nr:pseudouridine synthase [Phycisphaerae bacterium]